MTYFFNGGREEEFTGENGTLSLAAGRPTYDHKL